MGLPIHNEKQDHSTTYIHKFKIYYTKGRNICVVCFHVDIFVCVTELDTVMPVITVTVEGRGDRILCVHVDICVYVCVLDIVMTTEHHNRTKGKEP